jgi:transcriptional regulator GlxA family with amidase domain
LEESLWLAILLITITEDAAMTRSKRSYLDAVPPGDVGDERVRTVMLLIQKDGYSKAAVEATARSFSLSLSRLRHIFSIEVGISVVQYDKHLKLKKAKELIETTQSSIKEIALTVGYTSQSRFAVDFKRAAAASPTAHRARCRSA